MAADGGLRSDYKEMRQDDVACSDPEPHDPALCASVSRAALAPDVCNTDLGDGEAQRGSRSGDLKA
eukprot:750502-Hanusia_phi.AAC.1